MSKIHFERFDKLLKFLPKSKIKAGDGLDSGKYPFFTSSTTLSKFIDTFNYEDESLIFGSGGNASIHYCNQKFATSTDCFVVNQDSEDIDVKYVYYYLKSNIKILEDGFKGAGLKHISKKYISEIKIPLLSLQDQQKIVQLLTQIEELIKKREKSIKLLDELIKSTFLDIFGDPGINRNNFPIKKFGEHIEYIGDIGSNGSNANISANLEMLDTEDYAIMIRTVNLNANDFKNNIKYVSKKTYDYFKKSKIYGGEIIMNKIGSAGKIWIMPNLNRPVSLGLNQLMIRLKELNTNYLYYLLSTDYGQMIINSKVNGAVTKSITKGALKELPLLYPPIELQNKFSEIITQLKQTKTIYENSLNELNNLFGSIAQKAFKGKLDTSKIELIQKVNQVAESQESIIETKVDYVDSDDNPIFSKDFVKMLINQAGQLTNEELMNRIKQRSFKYKVSFDDIKKSVIELIENNDIEQIVITTENIMSGFNKEIGFKIRK
jgi:type I restriction enzyme S subunit